MKKLSTMTDNELNEYKVQLEQELQNELSMDASGDCGHLIEAAFNPIIDAIWMELEHRGLLGNPESNDYGDDGMPY